MPLEYVGGAHEVSRIDRIGDFSPSNVQLLARSAGAQTRVRAAPLEVVEATVRLRPELTELAQDRFDVQLVLQVHLEVRLGLRAVFQRLPVLAHDDEGTLERDEDGEEQIEEDVWERIERLVQDGGHVDGRPADGQ